MDFYGALMIVIEAMMLAMLIHVVLYSAISKRQKAWYILTFSIVMVCSACEYAVHCGYYDPKFSVILTILTVIQFSLAPMLGVLFIGALGLRHQWKVLLGFFIASFLVEVIAAPFGWIFHFDEAGYHRGDGFFMYMVFYFASLFYLFVSMFIVGKKFKHRDTLTPVMAFITLIAGVIPMTIWGLHVAYFAIAINSAFCYIYYNDLTQQDISTELINNQVQITNMQTHMISGLANLIENRDMETGEHISRTSAYVKLIAEKSKQEGLYTDSIDDHFIYLMYNLAPMHDIGKIIIPDNILKKPGKLTPEEFEVMKQHAAVGGTLVREVLSGISDEEYLSFASDIATYHHERWDGKGYPNGLKENTIPLSARIMAIADVFDALISERCYKKAMPVEQAFKIIEEESGTHFDPKLVKVFLKYKQDVININS